MIFFIVIDKILNNNSFFLNRWVLKSPNFPLKTGMNKTRKKFVFKSLNFLMIDEFNVDLKNI